MLAVVSNRTFEGLYKSAHAARRLLAELQALPTNAEYRIVDVSDGIPEELYASCVGYDIERWLEYGYTGRV